ncbi:MAG: Ig-like domain-containing protein [Bifidobacteriaceae bacterium]|nr:Ig-like domain-containing protein [Bifidobacteriaceae bacterium]
MRAATVRAVAFAAAAALTVPVLAAQPFDPPDAEAAVAIQEGAPGLTRNVSTVAFAGKEWWVIGDQDGGVYPQPDSVTLLLKDMPEADRWDERHYGPNEFTESQLFHPSAEWDEWETGELELQRYCYLANGNVPPVCGDGYHPRYWEGIFEYVDASTGVSHRWGHNSYAHSTLYRKMNEIAATYPAAELSFVNGRTLMPEDGVTGELAAYDQKLWALSVDEVQAIGAVAAPPEWFSTGPTAYHLLLSYGVSGAKGWWLRTGVADAGDQAYVVRDRTYGGATAPVIGQGPVDRTFKVSTDTGERISHAVRPALSLDLSDVLFSSPASGAGSKSGATVSNGFQVISGAPSAPVKFTLWHPGQALSVRATSAQAGQSGAALQFVYDGATTGANQYISAVLKSGGLKYYAKLKATGDAASGTVSVPMAGLPAGDYQLELFSEQANGDFYTDFASVPVVMQLSVNAGLGLVTGFSGVVDDAAPVPQVAADPYKRKIEVTFGETMDKAAAPLVFVAVGSGAEDAGRTGAWDASGNVYSVDYPVEFNTAYHIRLAGSPALKDLVGNAVAPTGLGPFESVTPENRTQFDITYHLDPGVTLGDSTQYLLEVGWNAWFEPITPDGSEPVLYGTQSYQDAHGTWVHRQITDWPDPEGGLYAFFPPGAGDVDIYVHVSRPGTAVIEVEPAEHASVTLSDVLVTRTGQPVTLKASNTEEYYAATAEAWVAKANRDGTRTKLVQLRGSPFDLSATGQAVISGELLSAGYVQVVKVNEAPMPRHTLSFPSSVTAGGVWVEIAPSDRSDWSLVSGNWTTTKFQPGATAQFGLETSLGDHSFEVTGASLGSSAVPAGWSGQKSGTGYSGMASVAMPPFQGTGSWTPGSVVLSVAAKRIPVDLRVDQAVANSGLWSAASSIKVTGAGLEQVKGQGPDFAGYPADKQARLRQVWLVNGDKRFQASDASVWLGSDGALTVSLTASFKSQFGNPAGSLWQLEVGGQSVPLVMYPTAEASPMTYGVLGVVTDSANRHSVVLGEDDAAMRLAAASAGKTVLLKVTGQVKRNVATGAYQFERGQVVVHSVFTFDITKSGWFSVSGSSGNVTIEGAGGTGHFMGKSVGVIKNVKAELRAGVRYSMSEYADPDNSPTFRNVEFGWNLDGDWAFPAGWGLQANVSKVKILDAKYMFGGRLALSVPGVAENYLDINLERLQYSVNGGRSSFDGVEAKGEFNPVGAQEILSFVDVLSGNNAKAEINTIAGERRYRFEMSLKFSIIEGAGMIDLMESERYGVLLPNGFGIEGYGKKGFDIIAPGILTLKGGGLYVENLVKTIDWENWSVPPPLSVQIKARISVLEAIDLDTNFTLGMDHLRGEVTASVGMLDMFSLQPAKATLDMDWTGAEWAPGWPDWRPRLSKASVDLAASVWSPTLWWLGMKYNGGIHWALNTGQGKPDWGGHLVGDFGIPKFCSDFFGGCLGPFNLAQIGIYLQPNEFYGQAELLQGRVWGRIGIRHHIVPTGPYLRAGYDLGFLGSDSIEINSGMLRSLAASVPVGAAVPETAPLYDQDGNEVGEIELSGIRLVGTFGQPGAQAATKAVGARTSGFAPMSEPPVPQDSYDLAPVTGQGGYNNIVSVNGLKADQVALRYDVDGDPATTDWADYPLVWERDAAADGELGTSQGEARNPAVNAFDYAGEDGDGSVVLALDAALSQYWQVSSNDGAVFTANQLQTDPIPGLDAVDFDQASGKLTVATRNLVNPSTGQFPAGSFTLDAALVAADGSGTAVPLVEGVPVTSVSPVSIDLAGALADLPKDLATGAYQVQAVLVGDGGETDPETGEPVPTMVGMATAPQGFDHANAYELFGFRDQPVLVAPVGDGAFDLTWTGARNPGEDTAADYLDYQVRALDADGNQVYAEAAEGDFTDVDGEPVANEQPVGWLVTHDQMAADGSFRLHVGGLEPGLGYRFEITPVRTIVEADNTWTVPCWAYVNPIPVTLPLPNPPEVYLTFTGATAQDSENESGGLSVLADGDFTVHAAFGQDLAYWEALEGDQVLASGTALAGEAVDIPVTADPDQPSRLIRVGAVNTSGDSNYVGFAVATGAVEPPLFLDADGSGAVYVDAAGNYTVSGETLAGYTVLVQAGDVTELTADADGTFAFTGSAAGVPVADGARWVSVTARDAAGNTATKLLRLAGTTAPPAAGPALSRLVGPSGSAPANGSAIQTLTAYVTDADGLAIPGVDVSFQIPAGVTAGSGSVTGPAEVLVTTDSEGVATLAVASGTAGTYQVSARVGALALDGSPADVVFAEPVAGQPDAGRSSLSIPTAADGAVKVADGVDKHRAEVRVVDSSGTPVAGVDVEFAWTYTTEYGTEAGTAQAASDSNGLAVWEFASEAAAVWAVSASIAGAPVGGSPAAAEFVGRLPVSGPGLSRLAGPAGSAPADGVSTQTVTAYVMDGSGAPIGGLDVEFAIPAGLRSGATFGPAAVRVAADAAGRADLLLTSVAAGRYEVTARVLGVRITEGSPAVVVFAEAGGGPAGPDPTASVLTIPTAAGGATRLADGVDAHRAEVLVRSAAGTPLPGVEVGFAWSYTGASGPASGTATAVSGSDGVAVFEFRSVEEATWTIAALIGGAPVAGSPQTARFQGGATAGTPLLAPALEATNGARIVGSLQPGDAPLAGAGTFRVVVVDAATGAVLVTCPVAADGSFDCALPAGLPDGTVLLVHIEGPGGELSPPVALTVDALPPVPGPLTPSAGDRLAGVGEAPGHTVTVRGPDGAELCSAVVGADLSWECDLVPDAAEGDLVAVEHRDAAGNVTRVEWRIGLPRVEVAASSLRPGESQTATGVNFQPGEQVTAVMRSTPVTVGTSSADGNGRVEFTWPIPADTEAGTHTAELTGPLSGTQTTTFEVHPAGAPTTPPTTPTTGPTTAPTGGQSASPLPTTGAGAVPGLAGAAGVLIVAGVALLLAAWRRRRLTG